MNRRRTAVLAAMGGLVVLLVLLTGPGLMASPSLDDVPTVVTTVLTGIGDANNGPEGIAVDTDRNQIFVSNSKSNAVYVIDGNTNQVVQTITHGSLAAPWGAAYNKANGRVYVASNARNSVVIINAATYQVEGEIGDQTLNFPDQVLADPQSNLIYVSNSNGGYVTVINGVNNTIAARFFAILPNPHGMAIDNFRSRLYLGNLFFWPGSGPDFVVAFSSLSFSEVMRRNGIAGASGIAVRPMNGNVYIAQNFSDDNIWRVAVVNPINMDFVVPFPGVRINGRNPMGVVYANGSDRVYVNGYGSNTVDVIDASTNSVVATLPVGAYPASGIGYNPATGRVYVANRSGSVTIIQDTPTGPTATPTSAGTATPTRTPTATPTPLCYSDGFEVDDTVGQAKLINTAGLVHHRNFCPAGDVDWARFEVNGGERLTMETKNLKAGLDTYLSLYAANGTTQLASNDDRSQSDPSSLIVYDFTKAGTYYLKVENLTGSWGTYERYELVVSGGTTQYNRRISLPVLLSNF